MEKQTLKLPKNFGNIRGGSERNKELPNDLVEDEDIEDFFKHLIFAVNQPNLKELSAFLENQELKDAFNLNDTNLIEANLKNYFQNWIKENEIKKCWISDKQSKDFFEKLLQKVFKLQVVGITSEHKGRISQCGIQFKSSIEGLDDFLLREKAKQVLHIVTFSNETLLTSIKVCQFLNRSRTYCVDDSHIFVGLDNILIREIREKVVEAFRSLKNDLLIVECNSTASLQDLRELHSQLSNIMKESADKKVVLIGEKDNALVNLFREDHRRYIEQEDAANGFNDLIFESQMKVLKKKVVLQGEKITLQELVDEHSQPLIEGATLVKLIRNEDVIICSKPLGLRDLEAAYTRLYEQITPKNLVESIFDNTDRTSLFMVSGLTGSDTETAEDNFIKLLKIPDEETERINAIKNQIVYFEDNVENKSIILETIGDDYSKDAFKVLCQRHPDKTIHWLEASPEYVRWQMLYYPDFYLKRKFRYRGKIFMKRQLVKHVTETNSTDLFLISNVTSAETFIQLFAFSVEEKNKLNQLIMNECIILKSSEQEAEETFRNLRCFGEPVHWMVIEENLMVWKRSHGSLNVLRKFIKKGVSRTLLMHEDKFFEQMEEKVVIIADEPGMGKSTTLKYLSELWKSSHLDRIVLLNLKNCQDAIDSLPTEDVTLKEAIMFLSKVELSGSNTPLAKGLLEHQLMHDMKTPLLVLFDGFDEIDEGHQGKIIKLLQFLKYETPAKCWVTTRLHQMYNLENALGVFSIQFEELLMEDRLRFLHDFWKVRVSLSMGVNELKELFPSYETLPETNKFVKYSKELFEKVDKTLGEEISRFMGIPLQLRLLGEVFRDEFITFVNSGNENTPKIGDFDILTIYERFIKTKYDIYFKEKKQVHDASIKERLVESYDKDYQRLAFKSLFCNAKETEILLKEQNFISSKGKDDLKSVGLVESLGITGESYFIHKTFAEYFSASFIAFILRRPQDDEKMCEAAIQFLVEHMFKEGNEVFRNFLDRLLAQDLELHLAILNKNERVIEKLLFNEPLKNLVNVKAIDSLGRTALHLAAQVGTSYVIKILLKLKCNKRVTDVLGRTVLHYATGLVDEVDISYIINYKELIPEKSHADLSPSDSFVNHQDLNKKSALDYAIQYKNSLAARYLFVVGANCSGLSDKEKQELRSETRTMYSFDYKRIQHSIPKDAPNISYTLFKALSYPFKRPETLSLYEKQYNYPKFLHSGETMHRGTEVMLELLLDIEDEKKWEWIEDSGCLEDSPFYRLDDRNNFSDSDHLEVVNFLLENGKLKGVQPGVDENLLHRKSIEAILETMIAKGHIDTFRHLVEHDKDNCPFCMYVAAKNNNFKIVEYLWKNYQKYTVDKCKNTALHTVSHGGKSAVSLQMIKYLLENKANVNSTNSDKETPLHRAMRSWGRLPLAKYFTENGADINAIDTFGKTPLNNAVNIPRWCFPDRYEDFFIDNNQRNILKYFIGEREAKIQLSSKWEENVIEFYRNPNAYNLNFVDERGIPRLHQAIASNYRDFAKFLIRKGADVNSLDVHGMTPLHWAAKDENSECLLMLLRRGAMYNARDNKGKSPVDLSRRRTQFSKSEFILNMTNEGFNGIRSGNNAKLLETLILHDFDDQTYIISACNSDKNTLLHEAADSENLFAVQLLLLYKNRFQNEFSFRVGNLSYLSLDINARNFEGNTPLHLASRRGCFRIVELLLENGSMFNPENNLGRTPQRDSKENVHIVELLESVASLFTAVRGNKKTEVECFMAKNFINENICVNAKDDSGKTLLHLASMYGHVEILHLLLNHGADVDAIDNNDMTSLHHAAENNRIDVIKLLLQRGAIFNGVSKRDQMPLDLIMPPNDNLLKSVNKLFKDIQYDTPQSVIRDLKGIRDVQDLRAVVNSRDDEGNAILHYAAKEDSLDIVQFLIHNGTPLDVRNLRGQFPKDLTHHQKIFDILTFIY